MTIASFLDFKTEWLEEIKTGTPSTIMLGNRFSRKLFTQWLDFDDTSNEIIYCDGTGDGGIDIAYLQQTSDADSSTENYDTWYIIQSKYGSAFNGTSTLLGESNKIFETLTGHRTNLSSLAKELIERLMNFISKIGEKDKLILLFATEDPLTEDQTRALNDIKSIGHSRLGSFFDVESISIQTIYNRVQEEAAREKKTIVTLNALMIPSGEGLMVGVVSLVRLFDFLKQYKETTGDLDLLYEKNVRKFLGNKRKVNRGIEKTLLEQPERFGLYNNGITIVAEDYNHSDNVISLTEPYIVNGCQTTRTIWSVMVKKLESGGKGTSQELSVWKEKIDKGIVIAKIVKAGSDGTDLLTETTRFTNSQNAVGEKDFIALESSFQSWSRLMANKYGVFLEIQRGAWDSRKAYQKQNPQILPQFTEYANAFDLLKVYAAGWLCEPGIAFGKNPPFAPGGSIFEKIVNDQNFGLDDLYAAYLLGKTSKEYDFGRGATISTRGQTRFLFFTITIELLKDILLSSLENHTKVNSQSVTNSVIALHNNGLLNEITDSAVSVIDDYLTYGNEDSLFTEPTFTKDFNAYLKWDKLAKGDQYTPKLKIQIVMQKKYLRKSQHYSEMMNIIKDEFKAFH